MTAQPASPQDTDDQLSFWPPQPKRVRARLTRAELLWRRHKTRAICYAALAAAEALTWLAWTITRSTLDKTATTIRSRRTPTTADLVPAEHPDHPKET
jgi:hypothetical protein